MDFEKIFRLIPENHTIRIPKSEKEWSELEQRTLKLLNKILEEKRAERRLEEGDKINKR